MNLSIYSIISWCIAMGAVVGLVAWIGVRRFRRHQQLVTDRRGNERRSDERRASDQHFDNTQDDQDAERRNLERRDQSERRDQADWQEEYFKLKEEVEFYSDGMDES